MLTVVCLRRDGRMQVLSPSSPSQLELCLKAPYAIASVLYPCTVPDHPKSAAPCFYQPLRKSNLPPWDSLMTKGYAAATAYI